MSVEESTDGDAATPVSVALPRSRKVRALLAYLALESAAPITRSRLCDLLWDVPNDPRGELRWCLSKLRGVLGAERVVTPGQNLIALDLTNTVVDALEVKAFIGAGGRLPSMTKEPTERLAAIAGMFGGDFLEGMMLDGAELTTWLTAQRQRYRTLHVAVMTELAQRATSPDEGFRYIEQWTKAAPFDVRAQTMMIEALVAGGHDAEGHVAATIRAFENEGLDWAPLREKLQTARKAASRSEPSAVVTLMASPPEPAAARPPRRGSVVVMPFVAPDPGVSAVADGLTDDIITRLAKLRVLFVIARGTSYTLRDRGIDPREAARILNVEYAVSGRVVRKSGNRTIKVVVEVVETRDGGIIWTDEMEVVGADETFHALDSIVNRIVAAVSEEIEREETRRAIAKPPSSLDAWESYHRGLWHMYKFQGPDNEIAAKLFRDALALDPTFARAHAGLSFTHFQNVFLDLTPDRELQMALAVETAGQALGADDRDPAAHWAMGRAQWLRNNHDEAIAELERSVELSPNFALGHYTLGFVLAQSGDPQSAITAADHSRQLSPFDPLQFGMLGARALAHMRRGEKEEAATWAVKAATRPNAHAHILAIAATNLALIRRNPEAKAMIARIRTKLPRYTVEDFLRAFRFTKDAEKIIRQGARDIGFD